MASSLCPIFATEARSAALPTRNNRPDEFSASVPTGERTRITAAARVRILVVEDEPWIAMDLQRIILDAGYDAIGLAHDASEALHIAAETRPALVLMDIRLAGERDGIDAAMELLRRHGIRSIFVSGHLDGATRRRAEAAKPYAMIDKPIDPDGLIAAIKRALGGN